MVDWNDYNSGHRHRVYSLARLIALSHHDGGLISGLGKFNTLTMTHNIVFFLACSAPAVSTRLIANTVAVQN